MKKRFFPWRLFRKVSLTLVVVLNLIFVAAALVSSFVFGVELKPEPALLFFMSFFIFSIFGAILFAYRFALPMRRIILKTLRIASKKQFPNLEEVKDDLFEAEPGEYFELEQALDRIRKKIKRRRIELAHEREESQTLMGFLEDAVVSIRRDGRISFYNSRFANLFLSPELMRSVEGQNLSLAGVIRDPEILKRFESTLQNDMIERFQQKMPTILEPQGRFFSIALSPLREEKSREVYGALLLFHDISEMKKAEQIRIEFVENASHELRSPLTSIKGFLETAREDLSHGRVEQVPHFLSIIAKSVDRLSNLVSDLLTISTLENNAEMRMDMVSPEIVTQEVFERLTPLASDRRIMLKLVDEAEPFRGDPVLIEQAVENLVGNAIKYIQVGGQIEVHWKLDPIVRQVRLQVKDNGPGIAEVHLERLFERFYRIEKSRSRDVGGTGLGLSIVKHIIQSHGGRISVKSKPGQGAEFICEFPFRT